MWDVVFFLQHTQMIQHWTAVFISLSTRMFYDEELEQSEHFYQRQPLILQLCYALYNMLVAHSEMVCFLVIIINHMVSASCVTLVLPITIFLWAMLSVPRPSKRYWMTAIVYTEVHISVPCLTMMFIDSRNTTPAALAGHHCHQVLLPVWLLPLQSTQLG